MKNFINPDTFFFVEFKVNQTKHSYGPYINLENAIEILVDVAPSLAASIANGNQYSYESKILERTIEKFSKGKIYWKTINTPLKEEKTIFLKNKL